MTLNQVPRTFEEWWHAEGFDRPHLTDDYGEKGIGELAFAAGVASQQAAPHWQDEANELLLAEKEAEIERLKADLTYADRWARAADRMVAAIDNSTYVSAEAEDAVREYRKAKIPL